MYVAPAIVDANKFKLVPSQIDVLPLRVGGVGSGVVAIVIGWTAGRQLFVSVTETEYVPPELTVMDWPVCPVFHR